MSDDVTRKREARQVQLELAQELWAILHRNSLEAADDVLREAMQRGFTGLLELRVEAVREGWRRKELRFTFRLRDPNQQALAGEVLTVPIDPAMLRDMYARLQPEPEPSREDTLVVDMAKPEGERGGWT